jgi:hypothetical protein
MHNVVEFIIKDNAHHELIRRCQPILVFLAGCGRINKEYIDKLWLWSQALTLLFFILSSPNVVYG